MGWEKRRFNRIAVSLPVELAQANIDLNLLQPIILRRAVIEDLSAAGMLVFSARQFRPGCRFRAAFELPSGRVQFFVIVKHSFCRPERNSMAYGHGMQIVGGTEDSVVQLVSFLKAQTTRLSASEPHLRIV